MLYTFVRSKQMALRSSAYDPLRDFRFIVTFPGELASGHKEIAIGFSKVSGLSFGTSDVIEYREGHDVISPMKIPGLNKYDNVTFERGKSSNTDPDLADYLREWRELVAFYKGGAKASADGKRPRRTDTYDYRKTVNISVIDRDGKTKCTTILYRAWPVSYKFSDLDASSSNVFIETLELAIEGASSNNDERVSAADRYVKREDISD
jgi:phage tail-like protein